MVDTEISGSEIDSMAHSAQYCSPILLQIAHRIADVGTFLRL